MATKKQCESLAHKLGCLFTVEYDCVSINAPEGYAFNDQTFAQHYADYFIGKDEYTKAQAYSEIYFTLSKGIGICDCDSCKGNNHGL